MDNYNYNYRKEIEEAITAADNALYHLNKANDALSSAGNWGVLDLLGGGFISSLAKHSKMSEAQSELQMAKNAVQNFKRELMDVNQAVNINIDISDFLTFADFFFDGLVADWLVQSRIRKAQKQIKDAISQINAIKHKLWQYR